MRHRHFTIVSPWSLTIEKTAKKFFFGNAQQRHRQKHSRRQQTELQRNRAACKADRSQTNYLL